MSTSYPKWRGRTVLEVTDEYAMIRDEEYREPFSLCEEISVSPSENDRIVCNLEYETDDIMIGKHGEWDNVLVDDNMETLIFTDCNTLEYFIHTKSENVYEHFCAPDLRKLKTGDYYHIYGKGFTVNPVLGGLILSNSAVFTSSCVMFNEAAIEYFLSNQDFDRYEIDPTRVVEDYKTPYWKLIYELEERIVFSLNEFSTLPPSLEYLVQTYPFGMSMGRIKSYFREEDPEYDEIKSLMN